MTGEIPDNRLASDDRNVLDAWLAQELDWIRRLVERRVGARLRRLEDAQDVVQETLLAAIRYGPHLATGRREDARAVLARVVENRIRDRVEWHGRARRSPEREHGDSRSPEDQPFHDTPSSEAMRNEDSASLHLALELLDPDDREVIRLREFEGLPFSAIADRLDVGASGARMRYRRALPKLARKLAALKRGALHEAIDRRGA
jgi:RNA polymerase sigma factor (sigma-70 family)